MHCVRRVHYDCLGVVTTVSNPIIYNNIIAESYPTPRGHFIPLRYKYFEAVN